MQLKGKKVFISGGARRLGREIALHLARQNADLIVHYHRSTAEAFSLQKETGCKLFQADFSTVPSAELKERLSREAGPVDVLINNASSFQKAKWTEIDDDLWNTELAINLKIPFFLAQHFGQLMKDRGAGKIINMVDIAAYRAYLNYLPYSIAKSALLAATQALARALAPEVQVNAIAPGTILFVEGLEKDSKEKIIRKIPAGRTGTIEELLCTIDFLLSDVDFITGQTIVLDGGRTLSW